MMSENICSSESLYETKRIIEAIHVVEGMDKELLKQIQTMERRGNKDGKEKHKPE